MTAKGPGIVGQAATDLATAIANGTISSRDVVQSHIAQLQSIQSHIHPLAHERFELALQQADVADDAIRSGLETLGPLHGVPITIKECFAFPGLPTTLGLTHRSHAPNTQIDPHVLRLCQAGAIVLAKTNIPQAMYYHETDNPVYGRTTNPWNGDRVAGGSSGGEAAAIATGGSPLGLGSDLGGSIRVPCHFCGIVGLKPTSGRLENSHMTANFRGFEGFAVQPGPMARYVRDVKLALRVLCEDGLTRRTSLTAPPVKCGDPDSVLLRGMRVGVLEDDGFFAPSAAIRRAVREAGQLLADQGATIDTFRLPDVRNAMQIYFQLIAADGGADLRRLTKGGTSTPQIRRILLATRLPAWSRRMTAAVLAASGQSRWGDLIRWTGPLTADQMWQWTYERDRYRARFWQAWHHQQLDALICPAHAVPAFGHGQSTDLLSAASYSLWPMLMGMPAGVVPVTRVRAEEERQTPRSTWDAIERAATQAEVGSAGMPIGVQVLAPPWRDEVVLRVMQAVEDGAAWNASAMNDSVGD
ncbi:MAG: amidase family protein [Planctomycetota bacterium]|nr:amidase family protein [Planctomycetota bacterium]MDA1179244.1 amidase family protein [Planctomycetota bacterium]